MKRSCNYFNEAERFKDYLSLIPASCTMVSKAIGIEQKNATRYKRAYEKMGLLVELEIARCEITGRMVAYLSTCKTHLLKFNTGNYAG